MMKKRHRILLFVIPIIFAILVGVITTMSLPFFSLGPEQISLYDVTYDSADFQVDGIKIRYYTRDELIIWFDVSGGDGAQDLTFEFICRDISNDHIYATSSGSMEINAVGYTITNSTSLAVDDLVKGVLYWPDVPSGVQKIKAVVSLTNIAQDTESFFIGLHQN